MLPEKKMRDDGNTCTKCGHWNDGPVLCEHYAEEAERRERERQAQSDTAGAPPDLAAENIALREQNEMFAAALAVKDEALHSIAHEFLSGHYECQLIAKEALALQPHASLVAKIKADAVREAAEEFGVSDSSRKALLERADRIELEGK